MDDVLPDLGPIVALAGWGFATVAAAILLLGELCFWRVRATALAKRASDRSAKFVTTHSGHKICYHVHRPERADTVADDASVSPQPVKTVVYMHGLAGNRHEYFGRRHKVAEPVQVITMDRPGYGRSPYVRDRTYLGTADAVLDVLDAEGVKEFSVIGWSSGGPYALALALRAPKRVTGVVLAAADPPWLQTPWRDCNGKHALGKLVHRYAYFAVPQIAWAISRLAMASAALGVSSALVNFAESLADGLAGTVHELRMERSHWGFELEDVAHPVVAIHGSKDGMVPVSAVRQYQRRLPHCTAVVLPTQGHFFVRRYWAQVVQVALHPEQAQALPQQLETKRR